jgi:hypothetical protein
MSHHDDLPLIVGQLFNETAHITGDFLKDKLIFYVFIRIFRLIKQIDGGLIIGGGGQ